MLRIGFVGWRGMVGSVLLERMSEEGDFGKEDYWTFFSTQIKKKAPVVAKHQFEANSYDLHVLEECDIIITCQGGDYTKKVYPALRSRKYNGYWIDSSSALRMDDDSIIVLDPVNRTVIGAGLKEGIKKYIGGNCTVSLMLMALSGLIASDCVEWISTMTYQAASGAGAKHMRELIKQMAYLGEVSRDLLVDPASTALVIDKRITKNLRSRSTFLPTENFGAPLAGSLIPWIDSPMPSGQTREEWKGFAETNKILRLEKPIPVDGICVRVGAMRCHSQGLTIKLKENIPLNDIEKMIAQGNKWVRVIPNSHKETLRHLTPAAVNVTLTVPIGRIRKSKIGPEYIHAFTVGDQLLWGAAEPLRRVLNIIINHIKNG